MQTDAECLWEILLPAAGRCKRRNAMFNNVTFARTTFKFSRARAAKVASSPAHASLHMQPQIQARHFQFPSTDSPSGVDFLVRINPAEEVSNGHSGSSR